MAELKWKTEPPLIRKGESAEEFLPRLSRWLKDQEREPDYSLEALVAIGGPDVAQRLVGFEGLITGYGLPEVTELVAAPVAGKRRIVVSLYVFIAATPATVDLYVLKGAVKNLLVSFTTQGRDTAVGGAGVVTLDAVDESLVLEITVGTSDVSYAGSYLDVD